VNFLDLVSGFSITILSAPGGTALDFLPATFRGVVYTDGAAVTFVISFGYEQILIVVDALVSSGTAEGFIAECKVH